MADIEICLRSSARADASSLQCMRVAKPSTQHGGEIVNTILRHDSPAVRNNLAIDRLARIRDDRTPARERLRYANAAGFFLARVHEDVERVIETTQLVEVPH